MKTVKSSSTVSASEAGQVVQAEARASASSDGESFVFTHSSASIGEQPDRDEGPLPSHGEAGAGGIDFLPDVLPAAGEPDTGLIPVVEVAPPGMSSLGLPDGFFGFG